jgi:CRISPR-associated protein (Cas_Csy4)
MFYINLILRSNRSIPQDNSLVFQTLHGMFNTLNQYQYGIAYEKISLQVFVNDESAIYELIELILHSLLNDIVKISTVKTVDINNYDGVWKSYSRYKIPTRKADRSEGDLLRRKRMLYADETNMLYFNIKSKSNNTSFRYYIDIKKHFNPYELPTIIQSNGYGLATLTRPFMLPVCGVVR